MASKVSLCVVYFKTWCSTKSWLFRAVPTLISGLLSLFVASTNYTPLLGILFHGGRRYHWRPDKRSVAAGAAMSVPPAARSAEIASNLNFR